MSVTRTRGTHILLPTLIALACCAVAPTAAAADGVGKTGASDGPPLGITPVTVKLQTVLDDYDDAVGRTAHRSVTDIEVGTIGAYGLAGHYRHVYAGLHSGDDFHDLESVGPFTSEHGRYEGRRWRRDENGITTVIQDTVRADENDVRSFVEDTENPKNDVSLLGEVRTPVAAYVVQVKRKNLVPFWEFYDKATGLLDRVEVGYLDDREIVVYDDYRTANGRREAWHTHISDSDPRDDFDSRITSDAYGATVTDADLVIPPSRKDFVMFPAGKLQETLPSDISVDDLGYGITYADPLIRVNVNGRGLDMLLDSAETDMVLDDEVAKELGLTRYGPYEKDDKGTSYPTRSVIASLTIGDLQLHDVAVTCRHVNDYEVSGAKAVGIIGYDFLASLVVSVDYVHRSIAAYDPLQFVPPSDSIPTPANVDDGIPFVSATVGSAIGDHFIVSTTSPVTMLFPGFWQAHPDDVKDQGKGLGMNAAFFYHGDVAATQLQSFMFGGVRFMEYMAYEDKNPRLSEGLDIDGFVGYDFLRFFDVYFDYPEQQIFMVPNDFFKRARHG